MALRFCQAWHSCWDCWEWDLQDLPHVVEAFSRFLSGQRLLQCSMCWSCAKPLLHASSGHARSAAQVPSSFLFKRHSYHALSASPESAFAEFGEPVEAGCLLLHPYLTALFALFQTISESRGARYQDRVV